MNATPREAKQRQWLWALGGLVAVLAIALVVVLVTRDDGSDSASTTSTTAAEPTTSTTTASTTSTTAAPATTTTLPYPVITDDPQVYAQYFFVAWQNNSQSSAANVANADAVAQMFQQPYSASANWQFGNCDPAAGTLYCTWSSASGAKLTVQVRTLTGGLPIQVVGVNRS
jgi:hypothetical protein